MIVLRQFKQAGMQLREFNHTRDCSMGEVFWFWIETILKGKKS